MSNIALNRFSIRRGLREDDVAMADQYLVEALSRNKREGLLLEDMDAWNDERTARGEETITETWCWATSARNGDWNMPSWATRSMWPADWRS